MVASTRVAYMTGTYPRATDTFIQREVDGLRHLGVDIDTFAVRRPGDEHMVGDRQREERATTTYLLPSPVWRVVASHARLAARAPERYLSALRLAWDTNPGGVHAGVRQLSYFAEAGLLAGAIRRRRIRHLHNHLADSSCTVTMLAAELVGVSYSFTLHGPYVFLDAHRWRIDEKVGRARFVACISHFARSQAMLLSEPTHWDKLHIVHCGVEPARYATVTHAGAGTRLLYVGRLSAAKGLPVLFESLADLCRRHDGIVLTLVGDGELRSELTALAEAAGLAANVSFVGFEAEAEVRARLAETDVFVLPSFAEGVPVSLMEAMASGVPVVTTAIAGVGELVEDGVSGFLVPPGDAASLTERLERLVADPALRQRFGDAGRAKVAASFDIATEVAKLRTLFTR